MIIADTNEFHPLVNGTAYRDDREPDGSNHPVVIMRATYGTMKMDDAYVKSLAQARNAGLLVGHYGYMVAGVDASSQGLFFARAVKNHGGLHTGDTVWCDCEEGSGDQAGRVRAFLHSVHNVFNDNDLDVGLYSGAAFFREHNLGSISKDVYRWIAAYGQGDPNIPGEDLWQFTDKRPMVGVSGPCDASVFRGNRSDFLKLLDAAGPFRHVVKANRKESMDELAHRRGTTVANLVDFSLQHTSEKNQDILNTYMDHRHALKAAGHPAPELPEGLVYWTVNP